MHDSRETMFATLADMAPEALAREVERYGPTADRIRSAVLAELEQRRSLDARRIHALLIPERERSA